MGVQWSYGYEERYISRSKAPHKNKQKETQEKRQEERQRENIQHHLYDGKNAEIQTLKTKGEKRENK